MASKLTVARNILTALGLPEGAVTFGRQLDDAELVNGADATVFVVEPARSETNVSIDLHGEMLAVVTHERFAPGSAVSTGGVLTSAKRLPCA